MGYINFFLFSKVLFINQIQIQIKLNLFVWKYLYLSLSMWIFEVCEENGSEKPCLLSGIQYGWYKLLLAHGNDRLLFQAQP